jgi:23S rRNA (cytosine1962-C5)-methyltransferase
MIPDPTGKIEVRRKKERRRHRWIFSNEIKKIEGSPEPGSIVKVYEREQFIGSGMFNPHSLIAVRLHSENDENLDSDFFIKRIKTAYEYRRAQLPAETDFRLVFGESDYLPGLVIDKYQNHFVIQTYALGMDLRKELTGQALKALFPVESIYEKNDFNLRMIEGLERREGIIFGEVPERVEISENGVKYWVDIKNGQKTGFYFDQRLTRSRVRSFARGRRVLDLFSYTGGFAINGALGGAKEVLGIDISDKAVEIARLNVDYNNVEKVSDFQKGDVFETLQDIKKEFDLIVLDPPSFTKSQRQKKDALRGYKEINLRAMGLLAPGGILTTCTCSRHISADDFVGCLVAAAEDSKRDFRIIERTGQGPDHPILLGMPETEYLKCFFLEVF